MSTTFWSNTIWYILLGIATILELGFILIKANNRRLVLALFITISGMTFFGFEMCTLMCVIEELFIRLGIYKHNWYRTWMTLVALLLLFQIAKTVRSIFLKHFGRAWRYLFIFFGLFTFHLNLITWASKAASVRRFNETLFPNPDCSIVIVAGTYNVLLGVIMMFLYFSNIKWMWKVAGICLLYIAQYFAEKYQLLLSKDGWFFILTSISIWGMYLNIYFLNRLYPKPPQLASTRA